jgi:AcrR family transcriptional regulator
MPTDTFFALAADRRDRLVHEAIVEFADHAYGEASLSQIARRTRIAKGSFYQYFEDKLDLYRWLVTDEAPRQKRAFLAGPGATGDFWARFEHVVERGMAFLVEHPRLARLTAAAADPAATAEVRGLHRAICDAGQDELRALLAEGAAAGAIDRGHDLDVAARLVAAVIGPGLTDAILHELGAELHEVLASDSLRRRLGPARRRRLAHQAIQFIRAGLGATTRPARPRARSRKDRP